MFSGTFDNFLNWWILIGLGGNGNASDKEKYLRGMNALNSASEQLAKLHDQFGIKFDIDVGEISKNSRCPMAGMMKNKESTKGHEFPSVEGYVSREVRKENSRLPGLSRIKLDSIVLVWRCLNQPSLSISAAKSAQSCLLFWKCNTYRLL